MILSMKRNEMAKLRRKIIHIYRLISGHDIFKIITESLEALIPIFMISAFIQVLINFPAPGYHDFITGAMGGHIMSFLNVLLSGTYGMLSLYMSAAIADRVNDRYGKPSHRLSVIVTSAASFIIISGIFNTTTYNFIFLIIHNKSWINIFYFKN